MDQTSSLKNEIEQFILEAGSDNISVFGGRFEGGVHCQQVTDEFADFIAAVLDSGAVIKNYLEIGVAAGGTTSILNHYFHPEKLVLVDDNRHIKAPLRPEILRDVKRKEIIGHSGDARVLAEVAALGLKYDLIVIDGDHTYPGVKADTDNYLPYLNEGGLVMYHDSVNPDWGIMAVMAELKGARDMEFVGEYKSSLRAPLGIALFRKTCPPLAGVPQAGVDSPRKGKK